MQGPSARHRWLRPWLVLGLLAMAALRAGSQERGPAGPSVSDSIWRVGQPLSMDVQTGRSQFQVKAPEAGSRTLVIVSALSESAGPFPIRLTARGTSQARAPRLAPGDKGGKAILLGS